ncbi:MAG: CynX/NimT family MFS transporter, partial [Acidimicrobiales bacterium]
GGSAAGAGRWWPDWRSGLTWRLGLVQGGGSALYFGISAFLPGYLHAAGRPQLVGPCLTALNLVQLPTSAAMAVLSRRRLRPSPVLAGAAVIAVVGLAGVVELHGAGAIAGAAVVGLAGSAALVVSLALPPLLAGPEDVHRLSAGMFTLGYGLAFLLPLLGGVLWDGLGEPRAAFLPALAGIVLFGALGGRRWVGLRDQLPATG